MITTDTSLLVSAPPLMRRLRRVQVAPELFATMVKEGWSADRIEVSDGLPADAVLVGSGYENEGAGSFVLVFEHESFEALPQNAAIPSADVAWRVTTCPLCESC